MKATINFDITRPCFNVLLDDLYNEQWTDVEGYDGVYQVSNKGRVKSKERMVNSSNGTQRRVRERILKQNLTRELNVKLSIDNIKKTYTVCVLVANGFLRKRLKGEVICQLDKDPYNCELENLLIMSHSESVKINYSKGISKDWGIGKQKKEVRTSYEEDNGIFKKQKLTHIKCNKCKQTKLIKEYYNRENNKRRECRDCLLQKRGVKKIGQLRKRKNLANKGKRICSVCKEEKKLYIDFGKSKNSFMGRSNNCKECVKELNRKYRERNKK